MKRLWLSMLLSGALGACSDYDEVDAIFVATNISCSYISVSVEANEAAALPCRGEERFKTKILVPNEVGISSVQETTPVRISVYDYTRKERVGPVTCRSGAQIIVSVVYWIDEDGRANLQCESSDWW